MLLVNDVRFRWPGGSELRYELSVAAGEICAVQGPSGVGKTTLLELISGFEQPHHGHIVYDGCDLTALAPWDRPVTTIFQSDNLFGHLTCRMNILLGIGRERHPDAATLQELDNNFVRLGVDGLQDRLPAEISGGQQQRIALIRAIMRAQPILLLDESFSALDWDLRIGCLDALQDLVSRRKIATLLVSHDERDATYLGCNVHKLEPSQ